MDEASGIRWPPIANVIPAIRACISRRPGSGGSMKVFRNPAVFLITAIVYLSRLLFLVAAAALYLYFLPSLIAENRNPGKMQPIFIVNLAAGWMFVPWVVALVLACKMDAVPRSTA
jgi:hypothetical protein